MASVLGETDLGGFDSHKTNPMESTRRLLRRNNEPLEPTNKPYLSSFFSPQVLKTVLTK